MLRRFYAALKDGAAAAALCVYRGSVPQPGAAAEHVWCSGNYS